MNALSHTSIRNKVADGGGLYLLVNPTGSKLWRMDYRRLGKRLTMAMGAYPDLTLKSARKERDEAREHLANGLDPIVQKRLRETAAKIAEGNSGRLVDGDQPWGSGPLLLPASGSRSPSVRDRP